MICRFVTAIGLIFVLGVGRTDAQSSSVEANWPQWRGPLATGVAPQGDPPVTWSETSNVKWKVRIPGDGTSTPIIWGDKVFIQTAVSTRPESEGGAAGAEGAQPPGAKGPPSFEKGKRPPPPEGGKSGFGEKGGKGGFGPKGGFGGPGGFGGKGGFGEKGGRGSFGGGPPPTDPYQFVLMCLDKNSGKTLWQKVCREEVPHEGFRPGHGSFAPASAITDGENVYAFFGSRGLYCLDMAGNLKWEKDLGDQETRNDFGEGATPALHGNTIVVPWDHEGDDFIVALDKRTGSELWRKERDEPTTWTTPLIVEHEGTVQVVMGGDRRIRSYNLTTGQQIWEHEGLTANIIPSAVSAGDVVFLASGFMGFKLLAIRLGRTGDLTETEAVLWSLNRDTPYVPSLLLSDERLYFLRSNDAILSCVDIRTGKPHYSAQRIEGLQGVYASPVAAGGRVYLVGRNGTCAVIKDADQFEVLATNVLNDPIDASPAIVGKQLFLRSRQNLYCIAEK